MGFFDWVRSVLGIGDNSRDTHTGEVEFDEEVSDEIKEMEEMESGESDEDWL